MDHLQRWSWIFRLEETETDLSIWIPYKNFRNLWLLTEGLEADQGGWIEVHWGTLLYITIFGLFEQRSFELPSSNAGRPRSSHGSFQNEMYERLTFFLGPTWERYQHGSIKYTIRTGSNSGESFDICRYFSFFYVAILIQNIFARQHLRSCFQAWWKSTHCCRWKPSLGN